MAILDIIPTEFAAGDTWRWLRTLGDYPATLWTVTYYFENGSGAFSAIATASGTDHSVSVAAVTTAVIVAGDYRWYARAVDISTGLISELIADENGWLKVLPNPAATGNRDWSTDAQKLLTAVTAALIGRASIDQLSMSIAGRSISRLSPIELYDWQQTLQRQVDAEKQGTKAGLGRDIRVRYA